MPKVDRYGQLSGNASEAREYYLLPDLFTAWAEHLLSAAAIRPGQRILDIDEHMLSVARNNSVNPPTEIEWLQGDAAELPYRDGSFDIVFCQQALQSFPDSSVALNEAYRVLVPGGKLALSVPRSMEQNPAYGTLSNVLERYAGTEAGLMLRSFFPLWNIEQLRDLITDAKFRDVHIQNVIGSVRFSSVADFLRKAVSNSPLAGLLGKLDFDSREELISELEDSLREYTDDEGVVFSVQTFIAVGYK
jgi:SAM-dependent methyltransferase